MRKKYRQLLVTIIALATLISGSAWAGHVFGESGLGSDAMPKIVGRMLEPRQRQQLKALLSRNRSNRAALRAQVRGSRRKLIDDLLAGKDTTADLRQLQAASDQLLAADVALAGQFVATLGDAQRRQMSQFLIQWRALHEQQRELERRFGANGSESE